MDFGAQGLAIGTTRTTIRLKIADHIAVTSLNDLSRNIAAPAAFGIPEALGTEAQQPFIHFIGKLDGPKSVILRKVRQHGMGIR